MVEAKIRTAGLSDVLGAIGQTNVQGEQQQKLDVYANQALLHCLGLRDSVAALVSEEDEEPVTFNRSVETGKYIIVFDPLDGSSNIDVNVNVGTIFSVLRRLPSTKAATCRPPFCSRATPRSPRAMWSTGPPPCWSTPPATACTASRSTPPSAPSC
jgi:fructose-1,6-bisphosphatase